MSANIITIPEGYTYEYLTQGFFIALAGLVLSIALHGLCLILLPTGILMAASKTGIQINKSDKKIRKYTSWTFFKTGEWLNLDDIVLIELGYDDHGGTVAVVKAMGHESAKTFDLILTPKSKNEFVFNQFLKVGLAIKTIEVIQEITDIPINNYVVEQIQFKRSTRKR